MNNLQGCPDTTGNFRRFASDQAQRASAHCSKTTQTYTQTLLTFLTHVFLTLMTTDAGCLQPAYVSFIGGKLFIDSTIDHPVPQL
jgi:hypothetical protein